MGRASARCGDRAQLGLSAEGSQALGPAWPQPAAPPMHRPPAQAAGSNLARTELDFGRTRWVRGNAERMNGKANDLNERNTFFICDRVNAGRELRTKSDQIRPNQCASSRKPLLWAGLCFSCWPGRPL